MHLEWPVILAAIAGGSATALLLYGFARLQRWRWRELEREKPLAALQRRFRLWEAAGMVLLAVAIGLCWGVLLAIAHASRPPGLHVLGASVWHWGILAFFAGNVVAIGPTHWLFRRLMGVETYAEFRSYQRRKFGFDSRTWMVPFCVVFGAGVVWVALRMLAWGVVFTGEGVEFRSLWTGQQRTYRYDQVMQVQLLERDEAAKLVLTFIDDRRWTTADAPAPPVPAEVAAIATTVSEHSGLPVVRSLEIGPG